jgi:hypothetical protein
MAQLRTGCAGEHAWHVMFVTGRPTSALPDLVVRGAPLFTAVDRLIAARDVPSASSCFLLQLLGGSLAVHGKATRRPIRPEEKEQLRVARQRLALARPEIMANMPDSAEPGR